jgi:hypothetical protein
MSRPDTNPKSRFGMAKPGIHAIPPVALLHCGRGMEDGEGKYGLFNWRENSVSAGVYYNAAFRHLAAWWDGEQFATDSGVHHLGHVMACCAIILDAEAGGNLIDDRSSVEGAFGRMVKAMTREMEPEEADAKDQPDGQIDEDLIDLDALRAVLADEQLRYQVRDICDDLDDEVAEYDTVPCEADFSKSVAAFIDAAHPDMEFRRQAVRRWMAAFQCAKVYDAAKLPEARADWPEFLERFADRVDVTPPASVVEGAVCEPDDPVYAPLAVHIPAVDCMDGEPVAIPLRANITELGLIARLGDFLTNGPEQQKNYRHKLLDDFRAHVDPSNPQWTWDQGKRTRLAFYIECFEKGVAFDLHEMDMQLQKMGY